MRAHDDSEPAVTIRAPTMADCPAGAACQISSWAETYPGLVPPHALAAFVADVPTRVANWQSRVSRPELITLLACAGEDGRVVGFATADREAGAGGRKQLHAVYVLKLWQGQGIGKRLVDGVLGGEDVGAEVWLLEANVEARKWYERQGFGKEVKGRQLNERVARWEILLVRD